MTWTSVAALAAVRTMVERVRASEGCREPGSWRPEKPVASMERVKGPGGTLVRMKLPSEAVTAAGDWVEVGDDWESRTRVMRALGMASPSVSAVSYTHLDVYKRQDQGDARGFGEGAELLVEVPDGIFRGRAVRRFASFSTRRVRMVSHGGDS